jgi:hypothetical protein
MLGLSSGDVKCPNSLLGPMAWVGPEDASGTLRWQRIPGGRLNAGFYDGFAAESGKITVEFFNAGKRGWGPVEVLWKDTRGGKLVPMGSMEPQSGLTLDSMDGHTFATRCVSGDGRPEHNHDEWKLEKAVDGRRVKIPVKKRCSTDSLPSGDTDGLAKGPIHTAPTAATTAAPTSTPTAAPTSASGMSCDSGGAGSNQQEEAATCDGFPRR